MDVLYAKGRATAAEVMEAMPDPPGYSAVRSHLATLEEKGHVRHEKDGAKYVFVRRLNPKKARMSAMQHFLRRFFGGSRGQAVAALLDVSPSEFTSEELDQLADLIEKARRRRK